MPVWIAMAILLAMFVGTGAGILGWLAGQNPPEAILTGGLWLGGTLTLLLVIIGLFKR